MAKGRKTGGRVKGTKNEATLDREWERELLRRQVAPAREAMTAAQIEHAKGVHYMMLRHKDGSFTRATDEKQLNAAVAAGAHAFQLFTQAPNVQAFSDLMNRLMDKPAEQVKVTGAEGGPIEIVIRSKPW